ncbi:hypothetical protein KAH94_03265 [bacterium]|nr:hypothetical protein [bacterium]
MNKTTRKIAFIAALALMATSSARCEEIDEWIEKSFFGCVYGASAAVLAGIGVLKISAGLLDMYKSYRDINDDVSLRVFSGTVCLVIASILKQRSINKFKTIDNKPTIKTIIKNKNYPYS